jgi:general secretion pathway protein H
LQPAHSVAAPARQRAFTLIEILVVLTIIVIVIGTVVLSVTLTGRDAELHRESQRLDALIGMAREQAEMQVRDFGLYLEKNSYRFMVFDPRRLQWFDVEDKELRARTLPQGIEFELVLEARQVVLSPPLGSNAPLPQIILYSSGDITSFEITMKRPGTDHRAALKVTPTGAVEFTDVDHMPGAPQ